MKKIEQKALCFMTALADVYKDEENRELDAFPKMKLSNDVTEDFTAMLLAMSLIFQQLTEYDGDLIDFTHMLNKLAVQHIMDREEMADEE
jgi:hypothetical protein